MCSALVTGATRGIGRAIAAGLADAGWTVHAMGRDRSVLEDLRAGHGVMPLALDLTDRESCAETVRSLGVDTLVHTAFRWPQSDTLTGADETDLDTALEVNLSATLHIVRALLPNMARLIVALPDGTPPSLGQMTAGAVAGLIAGLQAEAKPLNAQLVRYETALILDVAGRIVDDLCGAGNGTTAAGRSAAAGQERLQ